MAYPIVHNVVSPYVFPASYPPKGIIQTGLVGWWKLNEGSGQRVIDYSPYGNHGTLGSTAGVDTNDPARIAAGLSYDGSDYDDYGTVTSLNLANQDFTMGVVVKPASALAECIMGKNAFNVNSWGLYQNTNKLTFQPRGPSLPAKTIVADNNYTLGAWYYLAARRKNGILSMFIGGKKQSTETAVTEEPSVGTVNFVCGKRATANDYYFTGSMGIRHLNAYALTDAEIAYNFNVIRNLMAPRGVVLAA